MVLKGQRECGRDGQRGLLDIRLPEDRHEMGTGLEGIVGSQQTSHFQGSFPGRGRSALILGRFKSL